MRLANETNIRTGPFLRSAADAGGVAIKQENARLRVITDELSHRIKNVVGIIQSIARQTMRQTTTKDDFDARFSGRLEAFGRSLDLLVANDWHGAHIDELVRSELTAFGVLDRAQIAVEGSRFGLNPNAARNIGLALHELATNASKYGALSVPEGKVAVHWEPTAFMPAPSRPRRPSEESARPTRTDANRSGETEDMSERILLAATKGRRRTARSRARGLECATTRSRETSSESASV